jgi:hypothetical protein
MNSRKRTLIIILIVAIVAAAVTFGVLKLKGKDISDLFSTGVTEVKTGSAKDEVSYQSGNNSAYGLMGDDIVIASENSLQVFRLGEGNVLTKNITMERPVVDSNSQWALVYDVGDTDIELINNEGSAGRLTAEGAVVSASVNENGWIALCTQEEGYNGVMTVYDDELEPVYKWYSGEGYAMDARINDNNSYAVVLTVDKNGSHVNFFRLNSEEVKGTYDMDELSLSVKFISGNKAAVLGENSVAILKRDGTETAKFEFEGSYLKNFDMDEEGNFAVVLSEFQVGTGGTLFSVGPGGSEKGKIELQEDIMDISVSENYVAVLCATGIKVYTEDMTLYAEYSSNGAINQIEMRDDGSVIAIGTNSSAVYSS